MKNNTIYKVPSSETTYDKDIYFSVIRATRADSHNGYNLIIDDWAGEKIDTMFDGRFNGPTIYEGSIVKYWANRCIKIDQEEFDRAVLKEIYDTAVLDPVPKWLREIKFKMTEYRANLHGSIARKMTWK